MVGELRNKTEQTEHQPSTVEVELWLSLAIDINVSEFDTILIFLNGKSKESEPTLRRNICDSMYGS